jgi:O-antigen/teichoic acid export membrane protein
VSRDLTRGRLLARNAALNLGTTGLLFVAAAAAIPVLVNELGTSRFGLLALAWALIGTFGALDLGLGRALTGEVAKRLAADDTRVGPTVSTFLALLAALGLIGGLALAAGAGWLAQDVLAVPSRLEAETRDAILLLAAAMPLVVVATGFRGVLEAHQRFDLVNALRVPVGLLTFAGPLLVIPFSTSIASIAGFLVAIRALSLVAHAVAAMRAAGLRLVAPRRALVGPSLRSAGWFTVANVAQPLLMYPDRFLVGVLLSASAVAYYAAPHDLATKLVILPAAPIPVLFPAFATSFAGAPARAREIFGSSVRFMTLFCVPLVLVTVAFAEEGLRLWLGDDFAGESTLVLQLLAIGVLFSALAQIPFVLLQGSGRADLTAKLLLAELVPYVLALWIAIEAGGIEAAAAVWLARAVLDAGALYLLATRALSLPSVLLGRTGAVVAGAVALCGALAALDLATAGKAVVLALALAAFGALGWTRLLSGDERRLAAHPLRAGRS